MAPSRTASTITRPTRTASRKAVATPAPSKTKSNTTASSKTTKRPAARHAGGRKRVKKDDSGEDSATSEESSEDDYKDEDEDNDDEEVDLDSDAEDFEDANYGPKSRSNRKEAPTSTKSKKPAVKSTAKASKSTNKKSTDHSDLLPAPSRTIVESSLVIPRPKKGPVADAIQPETLEFLRDLKINNNREFMELNRARFDVAKADFIDFIRMVKEGLLEADRDVMDVEPKDSMMRINRDIRFSNDKSPYKRQLSCFFSRGGKKTIAAGYYFGVSSEGETFAGCGVWDPAGPVLRRIRDGIVNHSDRFTAILETEEIKKLTGGKTGLDALRPGSSQLKTGPAGFDKNHPMIEYLKRKCFAVGRLFSDKEVVSPGFLEEVLQTFDASVELVHILNEWIG
ncbi:hypothetical protein BGZ98_001704 [Dissophora globulifera]|nr:hypothetical protein BGZ98_001704 [Dissophora globulifera]